MSIMYVCPLLRRNWAICWSSLLLYQIGVFTFSQMHQKHTILTANPNGDVDIEPDRKSFERHLDLPIPKCKEEAQSPLGLLGTLMLWFPNLSITSDPIRALIRKNTHFHWSHEHNVCLSTIKKKLSNLLVLSPFIPDRPSYIFSDASKRGVGFCLMQSDKNSWYFIRCGSSTLTPTQRG